MHAAAEAGGAGAVHRRAAPGAAAARPAATYQLVYKNMAIEIHF